MNAAWLSLCGIGLLAIWLLRDALTDMCKEEIRTRIARLPYALLKIVALRTLRSERQDVLNEWRAELDFILSETDGLPLTRVLRGVCYSVSLLGLMLPFATARDVAAGYWWKVWRRTSRYRRSVASMTALGTTVGTWILHPLLGEIFALADLLVVLVILGIALFGSSASSDRAFRLLRWVSDRPEPPAL